MSRADHKDELELLDLRDDGEALSPAEEKRLDHFLSSTSEGLNELAWRARVAEWPRDESLAERAAMTDAEMVESALTEVWKREKVIALDERRATSDPGTQLRAAPLSSVGTRWRKTQRNRWLLAAAAASVMGWFAVQFATEGDATEPSEGIAQSRQEQDARGAPGAVRAPKDAAAQAAGRATPVELALTAGEVLIDGKPASVGRAALPAEATIEVRRGRACLFVGQTAEFCAAEGSRLLLDDAQEDPSLTLLAGRATVLALDSKQGKRVNFVWKGTRVYSLRGAYALEEKGPGELRVTALSGGVVLEQKGGESEVSAGQQVNLGSTTIRKRSAIARAERARHEALLEGRRLFEAKNPGILYLGAFAPAHAEWASNHDVRVDGVRVGQAPLSLLLPEGEHALHWGTDPESKERLFIEAGEVTRVDAPNPPQDAATPSPGPLPAIVPTPTELLGRARAHVAQGQWTQGAASYERLRQLYPGTAASHTVLVTLGQIQLDRLGRTGAALASFSAYLRKGGPLAQEARFGKIRALRRMGNAQGERMAIQEYLDHHPRAAGVAQLKERLTALSGGRSSAPP